MPWWKYKSLYKFKWREPYSFTRDLSKLKEKKIKWWKRPLSGICYTSLLMVMWFLAKRNPDKNPPSLGAALLISIIGGIGGIYLIALINYFSHHEIGLGSKAIVSMRGQQNIQWLYKKISEVRFENKAFDNKHFRVMYITIKDKDLLVSAVPDEINIDELTDFLRNRGLEVVHITEMIDLNQ